MFTKLAIALCFVGLAAAQFQPPIIPSSFQLQLSTNTIMKGWQSSVSGTYYVDYNKNVTAFGGKLAQPHTPDFQRIKVLYALSEGSMYVTVGDKCYKMPLPPQVKNAGGDYFQKYTHPVGQGFCPNDVTCQVFANTTTTAGMTINTDYFFNPETSALDMSIASISGGQQDSTTVSHYKNFDDKSPIPPSVWKKPATCTPTYMGEAFAQRMMTLLSTM